MELAAVLIIALVVFGPKRLPELGKSLRWSAMPAEEQTRARDEAAEVKRLLDELVSTLRPSGSGAEPGDYSVGATNDASARPLTIELAGAIRSLGVAMEPAFQDAISDSLPRPVRVASRAIAGFRRWR